MKPLSASEAQDLVVMSVNTCGEKPVFKVEELSKEKTNVICRVHMAGVTCPAVEIDIASCKFHVSKEVATNMRQIDGIVTGGSAASSARERSRSPRTEALLSQK